MSDSLESTVVYSDIKFRSDMTVDLVDSMGGDHSVTRAAKVSTGKDLIDATNLEISGLISYLVKNRHGSPFEHNAMTFRIEAPIFVWREFHRHRIGFSYNEESSRYKQLDPVFYIPAEDRNLIQEGKPGKYIFKPGSQEQHSVLCNDLMYSCSVAYEKYERQLGLGIAREVARACLPVNIYSACYVTCNARSLMNFLSLRTKNDRATFPSFPQREIEMVAEQMETEFSELFPITWTCFHVNGRVAP